LVRMWRPFSKYVVCKINVFESPRHQVVQYPSRISALLGVFRVWVIMAFAFCSN
jgi:hypothetical protein